MAADERRARPVNGKQIVSRLVREGLAEEAEALPVGIRRHRFPGIGFGTLPLAAAGLRLRCEDPAPPGERRAGPAPLPRSAAAVPRFDGVRRAG